MSPNLVLQDHTDLIGILNDVTTRLQTAEALRLVVSSQIEAEKDTKGWDRLPLTAQRFILAASITNGTSIPASPSTTLYRFLNVRNATSL